MSRRLEGGNVGAEHGAWGEDVAVDYLRRDGYEIVARNERPDKADLRLEIDIVAFDRRNDAMVFVEVKQHASPTPYQRRLRSVDKRKRQNLRRACNTWRRVNKWHGNYRFDVIEVYGKPGSRASVDHIRHVPLFTRTERFVRWS